MSSSRAPLAFTRASRGMKSGVPVWKLSIAVTRTPCFSSLSFWSRASCVAPGVAECRIATSLGRQELERDGRRGVHERLQSADPEEPGVSPLRQSLVERGAGDVGDVLALGHLGHRADDAVHVTADEREDPLARGQVLRRARRLVRPASVVARDQLDRVAVDTSGGVDLGDGVDDAFVYGRSLGREDAAQGGDLADSQLDALSVRGSTASARSPSATQRRDREAPRDLHGPDRAGAQIAGRGRRASSSSCRVPSDRAVSLSSWMEARRDRQGARSKVSIEFEARHASIRSR